MIHLHHHVYSSHVNLMQTDAFWIKCDATVSKRTQGSISNTKPWILMKPLFLLTCVQHSIIPVIENEMLISVKHITYAKRSHAQLQGEGIHFWVRRISMEKLHRFLMTACWQWHSQKLGTVTWTLNHGGDPCFDTVWGDGQGWPQKIRFHWSWSALNPRPLVWRPVT